MSISKITLTGKVVRSPEKRFTEGNLAITSFTINFGDDSGEKLIRVSAFGNLAETVEQSVNKDATVVVDGRLQTNTVKTDAGVDKKYFEINAQSIEVVSSSGAAAASKPAQEAGFNLNEEISNDELIGEDEIPF